MFDYPKLGALRITATQEGKAVAQVRAAGYWTTIEGVEVVSIRPTLDGNATVRLVATAPFRMELDPEPFLVPTAEPTPVPVALPTLADLPTLPPLSDECVLATDQPLHVGGGCSVSSAMNDAWTSGDDFTKPIPSYDRDTAALEADLKAERADVVVKHTPPAPQPQRRHHSTIPSAVLPGDELLEPRGGGKHGYRR